MMMTEYEVRRKSLSISLSKTPSVMNLIFVLSVTFPSYLQVKLQYGELVLVETETHLIW